MPSTGVVVQRRIADHPESGGGQAWLWLRFLLEGDHQQTPFGRVTLAGLMISSAPFPDGLVSSREDQDSIGINIEGDL